MISWTPIGEITDIPIRYYVVQPIKKISMKFVDEEGTVRYFDLPTWYARLVAKELLDTCDRFEGEQYGN